MEKERMPDSSGSQKANTSVAKYTDEQLNNIVKKEKMKLLRSMGFEDFKIAKEAFAEFPKIKLRAEMSEGLVEDFIHCKGSVFEAQQMLLAYTQKEIALKNGVKQQYLQLVINEVNFQILSEYVFEDILKFFLEKNKHYLVDDMKYKSGGAPNG